MQTELPSRSMSNSLATSSNVLPSFAFTTCSSPSRSTNVMLILFGNGYHETHPTGALPQVNKLRF